MDTLIRPDGVEVCTTPVVVIGYSGTALGNTASRFESTEGEAQANLARLRDVVGVGRHTLMLAQQGAEFIDLCGVSPTDIASEYRTDGFFTDSSDVTLSVRPADCVVMVYHSTNGDKTMGLIHGGRQGIEGGIHLKALEYMTGKLGVAASDVGIFFAPSIRAESYYFRDVSPTQRADQRWSKYISQAAGNYHINLLGRVVSELLEYSIGPSELRLKRSQLHLTPVDTGASDSEYFSHARATRNRGQEQEGRNGVVAKLRARAA